MYSVSSALTTMKSLVILVVLAAIAIALCQAADECKDGEQKKEGCNDCHCVNGVWGCTRKICALVKRQTRCTPGESFKRDCNTCTCSADGRNAVCTLRACLP